MIPIAFLRLSGRWVLAGFLLAFCSSFGQTYFISLFGGEIRAAFGLTHGQFGGLYALATLASATTLVWLGKLADRPSLKGPVALTLCGLAGACLGMAAVAESGLPFLLVPVIFALRLFGQGMLSHLPLTAMARWFRAYRGRALSLAGLGFAAGEALYPGAVVLLLTLFGWRSAWLVAAAFLLAVMLPLMLWLLRGEPGAEGAAEPPRAAGAGPERARGPAVDWTRPQVLRDWRFYALQPALLGPPFIGTSVFFHQVHLTEVKGWSLAWFAANFPVYALATLSASLLAGWAIDRFGPQRLLLGYLLPFALGLVLLSWGTSPATVPLYMVLAGATIGIVHSLFGVFWAELYGTRYLGAIRAMTTAAMVFSTAAGPGLTGWLLDLGIGIERQLLVMGLYLAAMSVLFALVMPALVARPYAAASGPSSATTAS